MSHDGSGCQTVGPSGLPWQARDFTGKASMSQFNPLAAAPRHVVTDVDLLRRLQIIHSALNVDAHRSELVLTAIIA